MEVHKGDTVIWMSFGYKDQPFGKWKPMRVGKNLTGIGYPVIFNGRKMVFIKLDACDNWALIERTNVMSKIRYNNPIYIHDEYSYLDDHHDSRISVYHDDRDIIKETKDTPITPIPIPSSILLFISAISTLLVTFKVLLNRKEINND